MADGGSLDTRTRREPDPGSTEITGPDEPGPESAIALARVRARMLGGHDAPPRLGRYRIVDRLGGGGMGVVYRAHDPVLDREIALKLLRRQAIRDTENFARMSREGQALAQLGHPNVVQVFEVGVVEGVPFLAMELVQGPSLRTWLQTERTLAEIREIFGQAAAGLHAAHQAGVVHRDFKPDNVVIGASRARVVDFGLASIGDNDTTDPDSGANWPVSHGGSPRLTATGAVIGTPAYMAPEQHRGRPATPASDQFSFCVALYEALFGVRPFAGKCRIDILAKIQANDVTPPASRRRVPGRLRRAVLRGLSYRADARWPDMTPIIEALRPRRSRRTLWVAPVAGVVAVQSALAFAESSSPSCEEETHRAPWTDARREAVRARFDDSDARSAASAWTRVDAALAERSARWTDASREACEQRERDPAAFDAAARCLRLQHGAITRLADTLAAPGPGSVTHAMQAVSRLEQPEACVTDRQGTAEHPIPADDALAERVQRVREDIDRSGLLVDLGDYRGAQAIVAQASADAAEIGFGPLVAEVLHTEGVGHHNAGEHAAAIASYEAAYHAGLQARHDVVAAKSAMRLAGLTSLRRVDLDAASQWLAAAEAIVGRLPAEHPLQPMYLEAEADLAKATGRFDDALQLRLQALEGLERIHGPRSADVARMLLRVAIAYRDAGKMAERQEVELRALEVHEEVFGEDDPNTAFAHQHLCASALGSKAYTEVEEHCRRAMKVFEDAHGRKHENTVSTMFMLGQALVARGATDEGVPLLEEAAAFAEETYGLDDPMTGTAIGVLASAYVDLQRYDEAELLYWKVIERSRGSKPHARTLVGQLNNLAGLCEVQGRREEAVALLEEAVEVAQDAFGPEHPILAVPLTGLGTALARDQRLAEARERLTRAVAILERDPASYEGHLGRVQCELGDLERGAGDLEAAIDSYGASVGVLEGRLGEHTVALACPLAGWGVGLADAGRADEALPILERVVALSEEHADFQWRHASTYYVEPRIVLAQQLWAQPDARDRAIAMAGEAQAYCSEDPKPPRACERLEDWPPR